MSKRKLLQPAPEPVTEICMQMTGTRTKMNVEKVDREVALCEPITIIVEHRRTQKAINAILIGAFLADDTQVYYVVNYGGGFLMACSGAEIEKWNGQKRLEAELPKQSSPSREAETVTGGLTQVYKQLGRVFGFNKR